MTKEEKEVGETVEEEEEEKEDEHGGERRGLEVGKRGKEAGGAEGTRE